MNIARWGGRCRLSGGDMGHAQHIRHYIVLAREVNHIALGCARNRQWGMTASMLESRDRYMAAAREWQRLVPAVG